MSILMDLCGMEALTAGELAKSAKVTPQTASSHLRKLIEGKLIVVRRQGRHKYYQLSDENVAKAIESIAQISGLLVSNSLNSSSKKKKLEFARSCYGHLAGTLGVSITEAMIQKEYLYEVKNEYYVLTTSGQQWLSTLDIDVSKLKANIHALPVHIDWTMRKNHLAGPLSLALTNKFFELGWIKKGQLKREIIVTPIGKKNFCDELEICSLF